MMILPAGDDEPKAVRFHKAIFRRRAFWLRQLEYVKQIQQDMWDGYQSSKVNTQYVILIMCHIHQLRLFVRLSIGLRSHGRFLGLVRVILCSRQANRHMDGQTDTTLIYYLPFTSGIKISDHGLSLQ